MSDVCESCKQYFSEDEDVITCAECRQCYHIGECIGISERTYKKKGKEAKKALKCQTCRVPSSRNTQMNNNADQSALTEALSQQLAEINKCLAHLTTKVDDLTELKQTVTSIEQSIQHMSDTHDKLLEISARHDRDIESLRNRVEAVEQNFDEKEIRKLNLELNDLQQYSRRQNLEIHGMPFIEKEDTLSRVNDLAKRLDLQTLSDCDVESMHRLPPRKGKPPVILIRFARLSLKAAWLAKRAELREKNSNIQLFDNLTPANKKLLWMARTRATEMNYRFTWSSQGKIFVRKNSEARAIRIASEDDLNKIV